MDTELFEVTRTANNISSWIQAFNQLFLGNLRTFPHPTTMDKESYARKGHSNTLVYVLLRTQVYIQGWTLAEGDLHATTLDMLMSCEVREADL